MLAQANTVTALFSMGAMCAVGLLAYAAGIVGSNRQAVQTLPAMITLTPPPAAKLGARLPRLDYRQIGKSDSTQQGIDFAASELLAIDLPPIDAFFPETGNTRFDFGAPTPFPAQMVYPTSPPMPTLIFPTAAPTLALSLTEPTVTAAPPMFVITAIPTIEPTATTDLVGTVMAFAATVTPDSVPYTQVCAPSGQPVDGLLTQRFHGYHTGIDWATPLGTPVLATHSGFITWADWNTFGYGNLVIIQNGSFITYYGHLTSFNVAVGQFVGKGSLIGWSGSTGNSSGPHVHYETRIDDVPVDPQTFESRGHFAC